MSAWLKRALAKAARLGLDADELERRVHGRLDDRQMVALALALEERLQA